VTGILIADPALEKLAKEQQYRNRRSLFRYVLFQSSVQGPLWSYAHGDPRGFRSRYWCVHPPAVVSLTIGARSFAPPDPLRISPFEYVDQSKTTFGPRAILLSGCW